MIRRIVVLLVLVGSVAALAAAPAGARGADHVSGTYTAVDFGTTVCEPLGETRLACTTTGFTSDYNGDLDGVSTSSFRQVIDCARGRTVGHGSETFTGSIGAASGTVSWQLWFTADFDCATFIPASLRIVGGPVRGAGGLAGVQGVLLFDDVAYRGVLA